jgi:hypothetical protein
LNSPPKRYTKQSIRTQGEEQVPNTTQSASWDFNPTDPVRLTATFSFDTEDTQDAAPVAAALAAIQARIASAAVSATQPDGATISITVTI